MIESLIENASTYGTKIDDLFTLVTILVAGWFFLAEGALFYFIIRFRRKDGVKARYVTGETKKEHKWTPVWSNSPSWANTIRRET